MAEINPNWVELQIGLYLEEETKIIGNKQYTFRYLHSSNEYCFYDITDEVYDENSNLIPANEVLPNQRRYAQYMALAISMSSWTYEQLNARFISVPVEEGYEIVNTITEPITQ